MRSWPVPDPGQNLRQGERRLTLPQRDLMRRLAAANYGELCIKGSDHRVYEALQRRGYAESKVEGWGKLTYVGFREALARSSRSWPRFERDGSPFGHRDGSFLITCPACGAGVGSRDQVRWVCDDGHVIYPKENPHA